MSLEDIQNYFDKLCTVSEFNGDIQNLNLNNSADFTDHLNSQSEAKKKIYRHLVFENTYNVCNAAMPYCFKILGDEKIKKLIYQFYQNHNLKTHYYRIVPIEFLDFILDSKPEEFNSIPYLYELAEFEVAEFDLIYRKDEIIPENNPNIMLEEAKIFLNPYLHLKKYDYPVHEMNSENLDRKLDLKESYLLQFRNPDDHEVYCLELSEIEFNFLNLIHSQPNLNFSQILEKFVQNYNLENPVELLEILQKMMKERTILSLI